MQEVALAFLLGLLNLVGVNQDPHAILKDWKIEKQWVEENGHYVFLATNESLAAECKAHPESYLLLPQVVHGVHQITVAGIQVLRTGDPTFRMASPFYKQASIACAQLQDAASLSWQVNSYSKFFARISRAPKLVDSVSFVTWLGEGTNVIAGGVLLVLAVFSLVIFVGRVSNNLAYSVSFGSFIMAQYFLFGVNTSVGLDFSMIWAHKIADLGLWIGGAFFLNAFYADGLLRKDLFVGFLSTMTLGSLIIILGTTGDQIQMGTMVPMAPCMLACMNIATRMIWTSVSGRIVFGRSLKLMSIVLFAGFGANDILHIAGLHEGYFLLSVGIVFAVLGLSVAVNQEIENTYKERDSLLKTLEDKVAEKTRDLQTTLHSLQGAQAELVHSAKLASLGTLSAGIAHEINNSINYVSGALVPLERRVMASASEQDKVLFTKLFAAIKEGTTLTVEIVRSLRNFTGLNQAAFKEVSIQEVFTSVLTILKSKLSGIDVKVDVEPELRVYANLVGMNQMLMNLITNAIDVMPANSPQLTLSARTSGEEVIIEVADNGAGMSAEVQKKIFDPFFTTKDVGKGTGLGLHIVTKEVERHKGKIALMSELGSGTKFTITLPKRAVSDQEAA